MRYLFGLVVLLRLACLAVAQQDSPFGNQPSRQFLEQLESGEFGASPAAQRMRFAAYDPAGTAWVLARGPGLEVRCLPNAAASGADWWVAPAGLGLLRIETYHEGQVFALSADRRGAVVLRPLMEDARQLWRVVRGRASQRILLESVFSSGQCLTYVASGQLGLQPIDFAVPQLWVAWVAPILPAYQPFWRSVQREIRPNPALPAAQIDLFNSHRSALIVLICDARKGDAFHKLRITPGSTSRLTLDRDSGATLVETMEIRSAAGTWDRRELVTSIPAAAFYDLSIYEEHLQSIAIDRTGKSPNPIEDVNFVPKSIGWLKLPAGAELPERGQIDVFVEAKAANNPGAVRRIETQLLDHEPEERPLESILNQLQPTLRKKF